jgi:hypothetical protein
LYSHANSFHATLYIRATATAVMRPFKPGGTPWN